MPEHIATSFLYVHVATADNLGLECNMSYEDPYIAPVKNGTVVYEVYKYVS